MNDYARSRIMMRDYARQGGNRRGGGRDYAGGMYRGTMDYEGDYAMRGRDGRQGVKGTGRYGIGGSRYYGRDRSEYPMMDYARGGNRRDRDYNDYNDYGEYDDYADYGYDDYRDYRGMRDYGDDKPEKLKKKDLHEWKRKLQNADGTIGEHFDANHIMSTAERMGIRYNGYDEKELVMVANMLYSDYCDALKPYIPMDKEVMAYTKLAKAWLEDEDAPEGSEKLALYYKCIVDGEDD